MKTRNYYLTLASFLFVLVFIFFSCAKEEIIPLSSTSEVPGESVFNESFLPASSFIALANDIQNERGTDLNNITDEAFEHIDPDAHPDWDVSIKAITCSNRGKSLVVYNADHPNLTFYNSPRFLIYWYKDGRPLAEGMNYKLECVCKGEYSVKVIYRLNNKGIGKARYKVQACYAEENKKSANQY